MTLSTADKLFLIVGLVDFGGLIACIGFTLYLAYTKMNILLGCFKNSPCRYKSCTSKLRWALGAINGGRGDFRVCDIPRFLH